MPITQIALIFGFIIISVVFITYYASRNKISPALTFNWYALCLVLAVMSVNYEIILDIGSFFQSTPSILFLTVIIFTLIILIFYLLVKINTLYQWNKNIVQEIALLRERLQSAHRSSAQGVKEE